MKDFIEKWNTDSRFKTKIKLGLYTLFVIIVAIFAFSSRETLSTTPIDNNNLDAKDTMYIEIPDKYEYVINVKINSIKYKYEGSKDSNGETIKKTSDGITYNYIFKDNKYFKDSAVINNIIKKEEVYDVVSYNYINLENINKYLSVSTKQNKNNIVYLKDIILGNDSEEYITITIDKNKTNIDYTSLAKLFDKTIESYTVEVIIEEKE